MIIYEYLKGCRVYFYPIPSILATKKCNDHNLFSSMLLLQIHVPEFVVKKTMYFKCVIWLTQSRQEKQVIHLKQQKRSRSYFFLHISYRSFLIQTNSILFVLSHYRSLRCCFIIKTLQNTLSKKNRTNIKDVQKVQHPTIRHFGRHLTSNNKSRWQ